MSDEDRRGKRRVLRLLQQESVWLQKALFALRKAEAMHEKVALARGEEPDDYRFDVAGAEMELADLEEALELRVEVMLKKTRQMRREIF